MSSKNKKIGGFKKKRRATKVSKGLRRSIAKPFGKKPASIGAHRTKPVTRNKGGA